MTVQLIKNQFVVGGIYHIKGSSCFFRCENEEQTTVRFSFYRKSQLKFKPLGSFQKKFINEHLELLSPLEGALYGLDGVP